VASETTILVVDDDCALRQLVADLLRRSGYRVMQAGDVPAAEELLASERIDLVVLDVMMPGERGTSFCQRLRQHSTVPVLVLSALGEEVDRIVGFELGADDYVAKPFSPRELTLRIEALLRRAPPSLPGETRRIAERYEFSGFQLDPHTRSLIRLEDDSEVELTAGEFTLLLVLIEHAPRILSREKLIDLTRGVTNNPFDRTIDSQISRLRRKLDGNRQGPKLIRTARNLGYAFTAEVVRVRHQS
jgi:two-component system OmpR family response regulator